MSSVLFLPTNGWWQMMTGRERSFYMHKRNCSLGLSCVVFLRILLCPWFGFVLVTGITSTGFVSIVVLSCLVL